MKPLWNRWHCRQNARLFILTLAAFFALPIVLIFVATLVHEAGLDDFVPPALAVMGGLLVAGAWKAMQRARARRRERLERSPLSCDELRVARSKLMKDRNAKSL